MLNSKVGSYATPLDAELARGVLSSAGIASRIDGDLLAGAAQWIQGAPNVRIFVAVNDEAAARELLLQHESELYAQRKTDDTVDDKVARAYRLALVGMVLLPVVTQLISLYRLLSLRHEPVGQRARRKYRIAMVFNCTFLAAVAFWILRL